MPSVEAEEFHLQKSLLGQICPPADWTVAYAAIGWKPNPTTAATSAGSLLFRLSESGEFLDQGEWQEPDLPCLGKLLIREIKRLAKGVRPLDLLTCAGRQAVRDHAIPIQGAVDPMPSAMESPHEPPDENRT